ncbi:hypothetical protein PPYR_06552 [Photinus pyralis]|uniref:tRNA N(3)-methylcytidine methyltransferase n=1 Tax=Photinus pyralis TaxID=7054 RepID=A0A5N4AU76_PHOPY|nr:tRNA N(3)-methylcytidine methyltransferase METTL6 isoform X2 [Photinus pyralis]XP_031338633.1 tRNA N(3)-methylcytidine methyltransferase METTL6 isoform X2 [Photinus pyralis]XP_031338634.1 tRNA N(3)-methylcytidine methyltransferase METTL6 isoform X2 [Photinus pyralis]KAB0800813.1 hypothetical protein PPYR_06552 [Photinus pyralis]
MEEQETNSPIVLTTDEINCLELQNKRLVTDYKAQMLEDRHWTTREFTDLLNLDCNLNSRRKVVLEIGCGVGNFIFPLLEEKINLFLFACDFSPRAIEFVKSNPLYNEDNVRAFVADVTTDDIFTTLEQSTVDIVTLVFVLSAIHPEKFLKVLQNIFLLLKPGGIILFRDYGLYDMAQLRFKAGNKISENFYMRQDGTRSYYFSLEFTSELLSKAGFEVVNISYIHRRTINKKDNIDVPRIFLQAKFKKP